MWNGHSFNYSIEKNDDGKYVVTEGDQFAVESVIDSATNEEIGTAEYKVLYFKVSGGVIVPSTESLDGRPGGMPKEAGEYRILVVKASTIPSGYYPSDGNTWATWTASGIVYHTDAFSVVAAEKSVENAVAFEYVAGEKAEFADNSFKYSGNAIKVAFAANGEQLLSGQYTISWTKTPAGSADPQWDGTTSTFSVVDAGEYVAEIAGYDANGYTGEATVSFKVDPIDLSKDAITAQNLTVGMSNANYSGSDFKVNGENIASDVLKAVPYRYANGSDVVMSFSNMNEAGAYTYKLTSGDPDSGNVIGEEAQVTVSVTEKEVSFFYGNENLDDIDGRVFNQAEDEDFDLGKITASYNDGTKDVAVTPKVTILKDGEATDSCAEPGKYTLRVEALDTANFVYGGSEEISFYVYRDVLASPVAYMTIDGKYVTDANSSFTYTQEAMNAIVTVKDGDKVLTSGQDFEVSFEKDGIATDEIKDAGHYVATIDLSGYTVKDPEKTVLTVAFDVTPAKITIVEAVQESYGAIALPADGSAATPTFVGYTTEDGIEYALDPSLINVSYSKDGKAISAEDLVVAGDYKANVSILATAKNITGGDSDVAFKLASAVKFADVDANAWYAESVYTAASADFKYMNGIEGTKLFMPEAQITRAEVAQVFANMADQDTSDFEGLFPTKFSDVDSTAWYAPAVSWASKAGIVTGYEGTDVFGTFDNATREQIATMIYRYAKAQGMDVTVEDEAAALAKYADGASVSEYAKTAMAYCVEQGIFGVGVDSLRPADNMSRAEMAATSVRVQPDGRVEAIA